MIGIKTALVLYALLAVAACFTLKAQFRYFALLIVLALAAKSYLHYVRSRSE